MKCFKCLLFTFLIHNNIHVTQRTIYTTVYFICRKVKQITGVAYDCVLFAFLKGTISIWPHYRGILSVMNYMKIKTSWLVWVLETKAGIDFGKIFLNTKKGNFHLHFVCMAYHYNILISLSWLSHVYNHKLYSYLCMATKELIKLKNQIYRWMSAS